MRRPKSITVEYYVCVGLTAAFLGLLAWGLR